MDVAEAISIVVIDIRGMGTADWIDVVLTFFLSILKRFVSFDFQIVKWASSLGLLYLGLWLVPNFGRGRSADAKLSGQLGPRLILTHPRASRQLTC